MHTYWLDKTAPVNYQYRKFYSLRMVKIKVSQIDLALAQENVLKETSLGTVFFQLMSVLEWFGLDSSIGRLINLLGCSKLVCSMSTLVVILKGGLLSLRGNIKRW
jgi:hypothetical protein